MLLHRLTAPIVASLLLGLVVMGLPAAALSEEAEPSVEQEVAVDRMVFTDGVESARFSVSGMCMAADDGILVEQASCAGERTSWAGEGRTRKASLGFDVTRKVEAAPADLPGVETGMAGAPQQVTVVQVELHRMGHLAVTLTGHPQPGLDPRPVEGSASEGGTVGDRSVTWEVDAAPAGTYEFSARFEPQAEAGMAGRFVPEVTVERQQETTDVLPHEGGAVRVPGPVHQTSRLRMDQVAAPTYGVPTLRSDPLWPAAGGGGLPIAWGTVQGFEAQGRYSTAASPQAQDCVDGHFDDVAPGGRGVLNTAASSTYYLSVIPWRKARVISEWLRDDDDTLVGFSKCVETIPPTDGGSFFGVPQPAGPIWDGEGQIFGSGFGVHAMHQHTDRAPANSDGVLRIDVPDAITRTWSGDWANDVPYGERPASLRHVSTAVLPLVVHGGDIDNRAGDEPVSGQSWTTDLPDGQCGFAATWLHISFPETEYQPDTGWESSDGSGCSDRHTLTPRVGAGGYWLESAQDGYDRDWSVVSFLSLMSDGTTSPDGEVDGVWEGQAVVPAGAVGLAQLVVPGGAADELTIGPGVWELQGSVSAGLTAQRFSLDSGAPPPTIQGKSGG